MTTKKTAKRPPTKATKVPPKAAGKALVDETPVERRRRMAEEKRMKVRK
jgi:hypothetical protein